MIAPPEVPRVRSLEGWRLYRYLSRLGGHTSPPADRFRTKAWTLCLAYVDRTPDPLESITRFEGPF
jgi:hypothetical protein